MYIYCKDWILLWVMFKFLFNVASASIFREVKNVREALFSLNFIESFL